MTTSRLHDFSRVLGLGSLVDSGGRVRIETGITQRHLDIVHGLYVVTFVNDGEAVFDNNRGGEGREVIPARSKMLKYGKFERGMVRRYQEQLEHLRRKKGKTVTKYVYGELVRSIFVLDLTPLAPGLPCSPARVFEPFWNQSIQAWLEKNDLADRNASKRSESRALLGELPNERTLSLELRRLEKRIAAAAGELAT